MLWRPLVFIPIFLYACSCQAEVDADLQAGLTFRFVQFTEWNAPTPKTFCVAGDKEVFNSLIKLVSKPNEVRFIAESHHSSSCHVLFIGRQINLANGWRQSLDDRQILTIAANSEIFNQGAIFGLIVEPKQISFRVNLTVAKERNYRLNSRMLKLAKEIY